MISSSGKRPSFTLLLLISAVLLGVAATYAQVEALGVHFLRAQQEKVHLQMLAGTAGNPWQYRILADVMVEPVIKLSRSLGIRQPESFSFIAFRFLQCVVILIAAGIYYRRLGLQAFANLLGLSVLTWSMSYSLYNSDLSFNVYFDVAFYLVAAILILDRRYVWVVLLMIPAALNRETSILIPAMLILSSLYSSEEKRGLRPAIVAAVLGLVVFLAIFVALRLAYGSQPFLTADGYYPGIGLLVLNLQRLVTWQQLLIALGIIPFLAVFAFRRWPRILKIFFWIVIPLWFAAHFSGALVAETRLLLVPQALIFIPGALFGIAGAQSATDKTVDSPA